MRAMWSGAVSFGLVSVPVKAYSATSNHDIRFHQVHAADGGRIKYKRTCSIDGALGSHGAWLLEPYIDLTTLAQDPQQLAHTAVERARQLG